MTRLSFLSIIPAIKSLSFDNFYPRPIFIFLLKTDFFSESEKRLQDASQDDNDDDVSNDRNIKWDRKDERYEYDRHNN